MFLYVFYSQVNVFIIYVTLYAIASSLKSCERILTTFLERWDV